MIISKKPHLDNKCSPHSESFKLRKQRKPRKQQKPSELETTRQNIRETPGRGIFDVATEWTNALTRDALKGNHHKARGRSSVEKIIGQIAKTNSHAKVVGLIVGESLILSAFASRQDFEKQIRSVVYDQCSDNLFLLTSNPNWRKRPRSPWERITSQERFAWVVSAVMQGRKSKQYTAISLNLSKEDAAKSPVDLIDTLANRIERALDCKIMLCVEEDNKGRSHCHGIYFGSITKEKKKKLKQAGGSWEALDSRHQQHTVERRGMEDAIGWDWYLHKNSGDNEAEIRIPNELRALGRAHYERVMALLLPHFIADREARLRNNRPTPEQTEPLDKNESYLSTPEKVSDAISNFDEDNYTPGIAQEGQSDGVQTTL
ncbi:hypothetical protein NVV56_19105 [Aeromonas dhakensis]|uniref:hypothetical protein n=1 Tax=Aeromonas dhakensis TaxID=196024 RepID=UPI0021570D0A|nr:hypothetical protein [Aeromonas dhakensis]MCR6741000.1 hypothetical protein [Aeromonas dhakensis]